MTVHRQRRLAKALRRGRPRQDSIRLARGVVVSSTVGQTTIVLDGGTVPVPAFNMAHTQSLSAGTAVRVLIIGRQIEILGAYPS